MRVDVQDGTLNISWATQEKGKKKRRKKQRRRKEQTHTYRVSVQSFVDYFSGRYRLFKPLLALQDVIWRSRQSASYLLKGRCIMSRLNPSLILMLSYMTGHIYENELQTHKRLKKPKPKNTLFIRTKTQSANVQGNPLYQATKQHLNSR